MIMKKQCINPYLPLYEHIPDGEPHIFENRLYVYGSHDKADGTEFCEDDYVTYSAPLDDLSDWRYEGVIFRKIDDPCNPKQLPMYAPDVCQGPDGRYYLYYCPKFVNAIHVAVCDTPGGHYTFLGRVSYPDGTVLSERQPYDPSVIYTGGKVYLYFGFSPCTIDIPLYRGQDFLGCSAVELEEDMLTVKDGPYTVLPSRDYAEGTGFEPNPYFEAPSVRRINDLYYLVYSSDHTHALCYAVSNEPLRGFTYGGVIISNGDIGYDGRTEDDPVMSIGNNHGGLVEVNGQWYIFYHRHTTTNMYHRQGCAERIQINADGFIPQVCVTTSGMNPGPLSGVGTYPAVYCCNLTNGHMRLLNSIGRYRKEEDVEFPYLTAVKDEQYITNIREGTIIGYKYISLKDTKHISLRYRAENDGYVKILTDIWCGEENCRGLIRMNRQENWSIAGTDLSFEENNLELYFRYYGEGNAELLEIILK